MLYSGAAVMRFAYAKSAKEQLMDGPAAVQSMIE
jgi:hypothetical protein